jgi:competence ComEA-like helix-hairpin-helix protein
MKDRALRSRSVQLSVTSCQVFVASLTIGVVARAAFVDVQDDDFARVGHETTENVCTECHDIDVVTALRRTPRDWNNTVTTMAQRGANATDDQFATIKKYLTRYYGLVAVNSAAAEEFSAVLGLTAKDANAIVEYRNANGKFADVEALAKVPGIDKSKIEAQSDALVFN